MANNETIADIVEEMRNRAEAARQYDDGIVMLLNTLADRLDAAHKREIEATAAKCCQLGRLAGYGASEIKHQQEPVGNAAKLREALEELMKFTCNSCERRLCEDDAEEEDGQIVSSPCSAIIGARNALAAPPRNCDVPFRVEGTTWNIADKAWRVFRQTHPDAYFDTPNLVRCIEWLFAHAESEEGAK